MTPSETVTLLPCPFCGAQPTIIRDTSPDGKEWASVFCENDDCIIQPATGGLSPEDAAVNRWNRRVTTPPEPKGDRVERMRAVFLANGYSEADANWWAKSIGIALDAALPPQASAPDINEMVDVLTKRHGPLFVTVEKFGSGHERILSCNAELFLSALIAAAKRSEG